MQHIMWITDQFRAFSLCLSLQTKLQNPNLLILFVREIENVLFELKTTRFSNCCNRRQMSRMQIRLNFALFIKLKMFFLNWTNISQTRFVHFCNQGGHVAVATMHWRWKCGKTKPIRTIYRWFSLSSWSFQVGIFIWQCIVHSAQYRFSFPCDLKLVVKSNRSIVLEV